MNLKFISVISLSVALIALAVTVFVTVTKRADIARSLALKASADAEKAEKALRRAEKETAAAEAKERAAKAQAAASRDRLEAEKVAKERSEVEAKAAADNRRAAEAKAREAQLAAEKARAIRDAEVQKAKVAADEVRKAQAEAAVEAERAKGKADELEKAKTLSERVIAEAKLLELRKVDFETIERDLREWRQDLEERERALMPEKTVADLSWSNGGDDLVFDENNNIVKKEKKPYRAEDDRTLSKASRDLARVERLDAEAQKARSDKVRASVGGSIERLYFAALGEDRVNDAAFYLKTLKSLYPDWEFSTINSTEKGKQK